ncbi:MAG: hypothetical protein BHV99_05610 [Clostridium sp. 26_21]|nr:MAG: hypothetical protein BHV99_05610 [Clostridium sp. 26_21]
MKKQYIITIVIIAFFTSLIITMNIVKENKLQKTKKETEISENIEDECTKEYTKETKIEAVVATKEKISANSQLILKKYFKQCDHTINEYVEMPQELVNLTKEEVQNKYTDWKVIGFEPNKVTLYKEFDDMCGEHFKLRVEEGKIVIYQLDKEGNESIYEKTNISSEYLTKTDLISIENGGLDVYGKEELNKLIEDFE